MSTKNEQVLTKYAADLVETMKKKLSVPGKIIRSAGVIALSTCSTDNKLKYIQQAMMADKESESQIEQIIRLWDSLSLEAREVFFSGLVTSIPEDVEARSKNSPSERPVHKKAKVV